MCEEFCKPVEVKDEQLVGPGQQDEVVLVQVALTRRVESRGSSRVTGLMYGILILYHVICT